MSEAAPPLDTLCPDLRHKVRVSPNAAAGFRALDPEVRDRLVEMLCDVAEVAAMAPDVVDFSGRTGPLSLRAGPCMVFYSLDASNAVTVKHVVAAEAIPLSA